MPIGKRRLLHPRRVARLQSLPRQLRSPALLRLRSPAHLLRASLAGSQCRPPRCQNRGNACASHPMLMLVRRPRVQACPGVLCADRGTPAVPNACTMAGHGGPRRASPPHGGLCVIPLSLQGCCSVTDLLQCLSKAFAHPVVCGLVTYGLRPGRRPALLAAVGHRPSLTNVLGEHDDITSAHARSHRRFGRFNAARPTEECSAPIMQSKPSQADR